MTFNQMYTLFTSLWDKSGSPYLSKPDFDNIANVKYNDWVEDYCRKIEKDEYTTDQLRFLYKVMPVILNSSTLDLVTQAPQYRHRFRFYGKFRIVCGSRITYEEIAIEPVTNDEIDAIRNDPFNKPTNEEPVFIQTQLPNGNPGLQVFSTDTPLELNMTYIRTPQTIDVANNPNTVFEQPDYIAQEIVNLIVSDADNVIENFQRMQGDLLQEQKRA